MSYTVKFEHQGAYSELTVWDDYKTATLEAVFSKFKRRGTGRFVLEKALEYAEDQHLDVFLEIAPFGEGHRMDEKELRAFYMSLGFRAQGSNVMLKSFDIPEETRTLMMMRPWGEPSITKWTENDAARIVDDHGLDQYHFFFAE